MTTGGVREIGMMRQVLDMTKVSLVHFVTCGNLLSSGCRFLDYFGFLPKLREMELRHHVLR